jgi:hypothetical protein
MFIPVRGQTDLSDDEDIAYLEQKLATCKNRGTSSEVTALLEKQLKLLREAVAIVNSVNKTGP